MPARRAMARWAWRLFRREWRQQLLVIALITIAVMATILGAAIGTNTPPPGNATFGTADYLATLPGSDPHLAADLKKITTRFSPADVVENESLTTGSVNPIELRAQNPNGPYLRQTLALVSGHYPTGTRQVALTSQVAALYNVGIGDSGAEAAGPGVWWEWWRIPTTSSISSPSPPRDSYALRRQ